MSSQSIGYGARGDYDDVLRMIDHDDGNPNFPDNEEDLWEKLEDMTIVEILKAKEEGKLN